MATQISNIYHSYSVCNLDTYTHTTTLAVPYLVSCRINENIPSGVTITLNHNGSSFASTSSPTPNQAVQGISGTVMCAIGDTLSIVIASPNAIDATPNQFKALLIFSAGVV